MSAKNIFLSLAGLNILIIIAVSVLFPSWTVVVNGLAAGWMLFMASSEPKPSKPKALVYADRWGDAGYVQMVHRTREIEREAGIELTECLCATCKAPPSTRRVLAEPKKTPVLRSGHYNLDRFNNKSDFDMVRFYSNLYEYLDIPVTIPVGNVEVTYDYKNMCYRVRWELSPKTFRSVRVSEGTVAGILYATRW